MLRRGLVSAVRLFGFRHPTGDAKEEDAKKKGGDPQTGPKGEFLPIPFHERKEDAREDDERDARDDQGVVGILALLVSSCHGPIIQQVGLNGIEKF